VARKALVVTVVSVLTSFSVAAQETRTYTRFLAPMLVYRLPGAHGSVWSGEVSFLYTGSEPAFVIPPHSCGPITCTVDSVLLPGGGPQIFPQRLSLHPPLLINVQNPYASQITFQGRVRDVSRNADTAGTEVPVIPETLMFSGPLHLLNVPISPGFRNTLRLYALPEIEAPEVEVQYFRTTFDSREDVPPLVLLRTDRVQLERTPPNPVPGAGAFASWADVGNFDALPEIRRETNIWIRVTPKTAGLRFWALVSVTNNVTQQFTLVSPMISK
jgi:hypothetical protein